MTEAEGTVLADCLDLSVTQIKDGWEALAMA